MVITRGKFIMASLSKCQLCVLFHWFFCVHAWVGAPYFPSIDLISGRNVHCCALEHPFGHFSPQRRVQKNICFAFVSCKDLVLIHLQTSADDGRRWLSLVTTVWCEAQTHTAYTNIIYNIIPLFIKCKWFCSRLTHLFWFKRLDT